MSRDTSLLLNVSIVEVNSKSLAIAGIMLGRTLQLMLVESSTAVIMVFKESPSDLPHGGVEVFIYSRKVDVEL